MQSAERLMKPVMFRIPCLERVQNCLMCCFCSESRADVAFASHRTDTYGSYFSVCEQNKQKSCWPLTKKLKTVVTPPPQWFCKAETRDSLWCENPMFVWRTAQISTSLKWKVHREHYSLHCEDFCKTLASTTMAGFSMSALLWTILSSSCAGVGLFPGPAISEKEGDI